MRFLIVVIFATSFKLLLKNELCNLLRFFRGGGLALLM